MKNLLRKLVGTVAPTIATALGGPLAGAAVGALAEKLGIPKDGKTQEDLESEVYAQLQLAAPEKLLELKKAEHEFMIQMRKLGVDEAEIARLDRQSARQREVETKDPFPKWLAGIIFALFGGVLGAQFYIIIGEVPLAAESLRIVDATTGILASAVIAVINYYFGSSAGSARKTSLMANGDGRG